MLGELKKAGTVRGNTVVKKAKAHTWEMCSLAEKIQLTWFQGEDYGLEEMLSWRNDKYSQALKHNNIIVSGSVRDSVAGTFPIPSDAPGVNQAVQDITKGEPDLLRSTDAADLVRLHQIMTDSV